MPLLSASIGISLYPDGCIDTAYRCSIAHQSGGLGDVSCKEEWPQSLRVLRQSLGRHAFLERLGDTMMTIGGVRVILAPKS
jgi:hypothetical protein